MRSLETTLHRVI